MVIYILYDEQLPYSFMSVLCFQLVLDPKKVLASNQSGIDLINVSSNTVKLIILLDMFGGLEYIYFLKFFPLWFLAFHKQAK